MTSIGAEFPPPSAAPLPPASVETATILVVDDDAAMRMLLERYLTIFGHKALVASDGDEALRLAAATPEIQLIILDLVLPGISGRALAEQLRAMLPDVTLIFCSGHPASEMARLGIDIEGARFMQKPCRPAELRQRVAEALAAR